jgi:hypothetical protein
MIVSSEPNMNNITLNMTAHWIKPPLMIISWRSSIPQFKVIYLCKMKHEISEKNVFHSIIVLTGTFTREIMTFLHNYYSIENYTSVAKHQKSDWHFMLVSQSC